MVTCKDNSKVKDLSSSSVPIEFQSRYTSTPRHSHELTLVRVQVETVISDPIANVVNTLLD